MKETFPNITHTAVFASGASPAQMPEVASAAKALKVDLLFTQLERRDALGSAVAGLKSWRADSLYFLEGNINVSNRRLLGELTALAGLPSMAAAKEYVEAGALMSYGISYEANWRRAASYADKILKGASPTSLAVERPTSFEFVVNLHVARTLRLSIPEQILVGADKVIG